MAIGVQRRLGSLASVGRQGSRRVGAVGRGRFDAHRAGVGARDIDGTRVIEAEAKLGARCLEVDEVVFVGARARRFGKFVLTFVTPVRGKFHVSATGT